MDLQELRAANVARQMEWPGADKADLAFRALELADEAGELGGAVKKFTRAARGIAGSTLDAGDIADEIADTLISLDLLLIMLKIGWGEVTHFAGGVKQDEGAVEIALMLDAFVGNISRDVMLILSPGLRSTSEYDPMFGIRSEASMLIIHVRYLAEILDIDLGQAVAAKFNKTSIKYGLKTTMAETAAA